VSSSHPVTLPRLPRRTKQPRLQRPVLMTADRRREAAPNRLPATQRLDIRMVAVTETDEVLSVERILALANRDHMMRVEQTGAGRAEKPAYQAAVPVAVKDPQPGVAPTRCRIQIRVHSASVESVDDSIGR